jgi:transposase-like protein
MPECPYCHDRENQIKGGKTGVGSQRYKCKPCSRRYTPEPRQMYSDEMRLNAVRMVVEGLGYRQVGRLLGVDHVTVMNWVKAYSDSLPDAPVPEEQPLHIVEMDELFTFTGKKSANLHRYPG